MACGVQGVKTIRELAKTQDHGYMYIGGVIIHTHTGVMDTPIRRVVFSLPRCPMVLKIAYDNDLSKCTLKILSQCVTWLNISHNVTKFIRECGTCQKQAKCHKKMANLNLLTVLGSPFRRMAFDSVGPYPHTKSGYQYYSNHHLLFQ